MRVKELSSRLALYAWLVSGLAALFYTYEYLLRIEPSVMVGQLMRSFAITASGLGVLSAMYYYAYTPLQAVVGVITDYFGPKKVLTVAIVFCAAGSFLFAETHNVYIAAMGRLLIGIGSAFAFVGVLKLAAMWLPHNRFAVFAGLTTSLGMVGALLGDVGMSWMVQNYGWHRVVLLSALGGLALIPIFLLFVRENKAHQDNEPWTGLKDYLTSFFKIFTNHQLISAGLIGCLLFLSLTVVAEMWGIPFVRAATGLSKVRSAEINSLIFLGWLVGSPIAGILSEKLKTRRLLLIVGSLSAALVFSVVLLWTYMNPILLALMLFLFGVFSSVEVICFVIGRDTVPVKLIATAMGMVNLLIMLGGMVVQPLVGWLLDVLWSGAAGLGVRVYSVNEYRLALLIVPVGMLIAAYLAYKMKETHPARTT